MASCLHLFSKSTAKGQHDGETDRIRSRGPGRPHAARACFPPSRAPVRTRGSSPSSRTDRAQAQAIAQQFRAVAYHTDEFRQCLQREDVNAVYLALPPTLHCDYAVEAARAGVHVLCERPMAVMADECRRMIRTAQTNRVKLMIAYRLQFHPGPRRGARARARRRHRHAAARSPPTSPSGSRPPRIPDCSGAWAAAACTTSA